MSQTSTMAPVLAAVVARLERDMPGDVQVIYGPRVVVTVTQATIVTIGIINFQPSVSTFGTAIDDLPEDEQYDISCVVEAFMPGAGTAAQQAATEQALGTYADVRASLQADGNDETLGVPNVQWIRVIARGQVIPSVDPKVIGKGRGCAVPFTLTVMGVL